MLTHVQNENGNIISSWCMLGSYWSCYFQILTMALFSEGNVIFHIHIHRCIQGNVDLIQKLLSCVIGWTWIRISQELPCGVTTQLDLTWPWVVHNTTNTTPAPHNILSGNVRGEMDHGAGNQLQTWTINATGRCSGCLMIHVIPKILFTYLVLYIHVYACD